jgi:hypothetical protein
MLQASGPVQSTYSRYEPVGSVGTPASETGYDVDTKIFEEHASPAAGVGFGVVVRQGTADRGARLGGSGDVLGITMANPTQNVSVFTDKYAGGDNMPVMIRGDLWVITEAAVVAGEALYYNTSTGVLGHSGGTAILGGRWMTSASAGQLAVVRLGSPASE